MRASSSWTFTRTLSPALCTLPSSTVPTPSSFATVFKSSGVLLYLAVDFREITFRSPMRVSSEFHPEYRRQNKRLLFLRSGCRMGEPRCFSPEMKKLPAKHWDEGVGKAGSQ